MCLPRFLKTHLLYIARVVSVLLEKRAEQKHPHVESRLFDLRLVLVGVDLVAMTTNMAKERNRRCTAETAFSL